MGLTLFSFVVGHGARTFFSLDFQLHQPHGTDKYCPVPYEVYISQLTRFARVCSYVDDFNTRNKCLTA